MRGRLKRPEAHEAYLRGRFFWNQFSPAGFHKALEYFRAAIAHDPRYAEAYVGLADCLAMLGWYGVLAPSDSLRPAGEAARKALDLSVELAEAHNSLAAVKDIYERHSGRRFYDAGEYGRAVDELRVALDLGPGFSPAKLFLAAAWRQQGEFAAAVTELEQAVALSNGSSVYVAALGRAYAVAGR